MIPFIVTIRTANRAPKQNYLRATVQAFLEGGCDPLRLHLFPTDPDVTWLEHELSGLPSVRVHAPDRRKLPNENGLAQVTALNETKAEWIGLFEDDLELCGDPMGSMTRWLWSHADPQWHVYRFCALPGTKTKPYRPHAVLAPLREMRGSQAIALRADDAWVFMEWAQAHPKNWRPPDAPFQDRPDRGFDKLVGYWALSQWPDQPYGLVSQPMLVRHAGRHSILHSHGVSDDRAFAGRTWQYWDEPERSPTWHL